MTVNRQYDASQQSLDIQRLHFDPGMATAVNCRADPSREYAQGEDLGPMLGLVVMLLPLDLSNKKPYQLHGLSNTMQNASNTKNLNFSNTEVKSAGEMDKGQWMEPERMCVDRNPPCTTFPDKSTNISCLQDPELPMTVPACREQLTWSSGRTTVPMLSSLCHKVDKVSTSIQWAPNPTCAYFPFLPGVPGPFQGRAIREYFSKLLRLDGQELPSPVIIDVDTPYVIKPCKVLLDL
ncbi:hypothetical protein E2I00_014618 [Balaenoptera physalus]|uniref:NXF1/2/3/5-like leucine-rich repeat domain-containing protein n=1 Tax=Balaenoptera physalus TaxID=9770 RepID=A0A643BL81_BALPH|nr:hypothetical protein E2I00_014618 [Balaenoptera physalus]